MKLQRFHRAALSLLLFFAPAAEAETATIAITGTDFPRGAPLPLEHRPQSTAAQDRFLRRLDADRIGYQDFEAIALGNGELETIPFAPTQVSAEIAWGAAVRTTTDFWVEHYGIYAASGSRYLETSAEADTPLFEISFSTPVTAFGFHAIGANDELEGESIGLQLQLGHSDGKTSSVFEAGLGVLETGSVTFVGVLSPEDPFDQVQFNWQSIFGDIGTGIDDLYIGFAVPEPVRFGMVRLLISMAIAFRFARRC